MVHNPEWIKYFPPTSLLPLPDYYCCGWVAFHSFYRGWCYTQKYRSVWKWRRKRENPRTNQNMQPDADSQKRRSFVQLSVHKWRISCSCFTLKCRTDLGEFIRTEEKKNVLAAWWVEKDLTNRSRPSRTTFTWDHPTDVSAEAGCVGILRAPCSTLAQRTLFSATCICSRNELWVWGHSILNVLTDS